MVNIDSFKYLVRFWWVSSLLALLLMHYLFETNPFFLSKYLGWNTSYLDFVRPEELISIALFLMPRAVFTYFFISKILKKPSLFVIKIDGKSFALLSLISLVLSFIYSPLSRILLYYTFIAYIVNSRNKLRFFALVSCIISVVVGRLGGRGTILTFMLLFLFTSEGKGFRYYLTWLIPSGIVMTLMKFGGGISLISVGVNLIDRFSFFNQIKTYFVLNNLGWQTDNPLYISYHKIPLLRSFFGSENEIEHLLFQEMTGNVGGWAVSPEILSMCSGSELTTAFFYLSLFYMFIFLLFLGISKSKIIAPIILVNLIHILLMESMNIVGFVLVDVVLFAFVHWSLKTIVNNEF